LASDLLLKLVFFLEGPEGKVNCETIVFLQKATNFIFYCISRHRIKSSPPQESECPDEHPQRSADSNSTYSNSDNHHQSLIVHYRPLASSDQKDGADNYNEYFRFQACR